jgi:hypothetical protein
MALHKLTEIIIDEFQEPRSSNSAWVLVLLLRVVFRGLFALLEAKTWAAETGRREQQLLQIGQPASV